MIVPLIRIDIGQFQCTVSRVVSKSNKLHYRLYLFQCLVSLIVSKTKKELMKSCMFYQESMISCSKDICSTHVATN